MSRRSAGIRKVGMMVKTIKMPDDFFYAPRRTRRWIPACVQEFISCMRARRWIRAICHSGVCFVVLSFVARDLGVPTGSFR